MRAATQWVPEHFIGGHPALDLANAVYDRRVPVADNDLFRSVGDIANWLHGTGLADATQAEAVSGLPEAALLEPVRAVRQATFSIFDAIASAKPPPVGALGLLFRRAAGMPGVQPLRWRGTRPVLGPSQWHDPDAVIALLAMVSIEAFYTLPRERVRSCPRCGWLFVDASRGGRRRWCSMQTCGNREKVSRHRAHPDAGSARDRNASSV